MEAARTGPRMARCGGLLRVARHDGTPGTSGRSDPGPAGERLGDSLGDERGRGDAYRGPDRRSRWRLEELDGATPRVLKRSAAGLPFAVAPAVLAVARGATPAVAAELILLVSSLAAVGAGVASLVSWRILGKTYPAWRAVALLDLGVLSFVSNSLALLRVGGRPGFVALEQLTTGLLVAGVVIAGLRAEEVDAGLQPLRRLARALVCGMCLLGALNLLFAHRTLPGWMTEPSLLLGGRLALGGAFVAFGIVARRAPAARRGRWVPAVLVGFGLSYAAAAISLPSPGVWGLVAAVLRLVAVGVAVGSVGAELAAVVRSQDRYSVGLRHDLDALNATMVGERASVEERLHDLRNAVAALRSADAALRQYADRLDARTQSLLAHAVSAELGRLQALVERDQQLRVEPFRVVEALGPLLAAEESHGTDLRVELEDVAAVGDVEAFARVVQNLLVNARRYAPGAPVRVVVGRRVGRVEVRVEDGGPGVPPAERMAIFTRGTRGRASKDVAGSGLGLHVAVRLMEEMGGSLRLEDRAGEGDAEEPGACFVIELAEASEEAVADHDHPRFDRLEEHLGASA